MHDLGVAIQLGGGAKESAIKLLLHNKHPIFTYFVCLFGMTLGVEANGCHGS